MTRVTVGKEAANELEEAALWYENEQTGLGSKFLDAFASAIELLHEANPPLTPMHGEAGKKGAKKLILHKFPFSIVIYESKQEYVVVALAHHSRKPGYWQDRV